MRIHKITLYKYTGALNLFHQDGESEVIIFDNKYNDKNQINIFIMPNKSGKSLVYNALEALIGYNKNGFIKDTDKDLSIKIEFSINGEEYLFESTYSHPYRIYQNDVEVTNFEEILRKELGLNIGRMEYFGNNRNSLHSISRFICLNFEGIKSKDESNKIPLINADHDGRSRRLLLAYVLGANISNEHFKIITEIEYKEDFIKKHRKEFEKINTKAQGALGIDSSLNKLFGELEERRMILGEALDQKILDKN